MGTELPVEPAIAELVELIGAEPAVELVNAEPVELMAGKLTRRRQQSPGGGNAEHNSHSEHRIAGSCPPRAATPADNRRGRMPAHARMRQSSPELTGTRLSSLEHT